MKKLVQKAKKLSLKGSKKSTKKSTKKEAAATPVTPPGPVMQAVKAEDPAEVDNDNKEEEEDAMWPDLEPKKGWSTDSQWPPEGVKNADAFMDHYSGIGLAGIKDEFKKKIEEFKTSTYGDVAFKANPTKNRDKDIMACLDHSRVELEDKRYINASWVFDRTRLETTYILTQEPILSTICDFWQMVYQHKVSCIVVFSEKEDGWPPKRLPGNPPECETIMNKFWPIKKSNGLKTENLCTKRLIQDLKHDHYYEEMKIGCEQTRVETFLTFIRKTQWNPDELRSTLNDIAMVAQNGRTLSSVGPILLMDDYSGTSRAAVLTVVDAMGSLMYKGEQNLTLPQVVKTEDDYVFIIRSLFFCIKEVFDESRIEDEAVKKRGEKYAKQYAQLFGGGGKKK
ncbi:hypothetical protein PRIPAC_87988 [Pristionchus pacificus]|uniref:Tyrosine phosphatase n=1 Tax=Pristionchus pacificus TaxID=54126 RepID=A0A2A6B7M4_PRIPA|nr:hypothetical protein PRIPAC_87988 [Pristionchus pacificus]|eukprot:PDM61889.1 tyrosine phosphatase [Pristionchus pacificus]